MTPPTPRSDGSHPSAPVDQAPLVGGSIAARIARALNEPVRVFEIDEDEGAALVVERLHFHPIYRAPHGVMVRRLHATLNSEVRPHDPE